MLRLAVFSILICLTVQYKMPCTNEKDCPRNSNCTSLSTGGKFCFCNAGYVDDLQDSLYCLKVATNISDPCVEDNQCKAGLGAKSECFLNSTNNQTGYCRCQSNSHFSEGQCYITANLGDKCMVTNECVIKSQNLKAYCESEICVCPPGYSATDDKTDCIASVNTLGVGQDRLLSEGIPQLNIQKFNSIWLGNTCTDDSQCNPKHSECMNVCKCKQGYIANHNKSDCLPVIDKLGSLCLEEQQCVHQIKHAGCINSMCQCKNYSHQVGFSCYETHYLDDICEKDQQCVTTSNNYTTFGCNNGICSCKPGFKRVKSDCVAPGGASFMRAASVWFLFPMLVASFTLLN